MAQDGTAHALSADESGQLDAAALVAAVGLDRVLAAQAGATADMDALSQAVYETFAN